ncbi:MAG: hypothetical protein JSS60_03980 [Verrucomicrobia bacterium]|nr:hypothetical protein [Verrucomicrobiota bacterium]
MSVRQTTSEGSLYSHRTEAPTSPPRDQLRVSTASAFRRVSPTIESTSVLRRDKDGFAIPAPLTAEQLAERALRKGQTRASADKQVVLSERTGKPLSQETIDYGRKMKELMDAAVQKREEHQAVQKFNEQWKSFPSGDKQ